MGELAVFIVLPYFMNHVYKMLLTKPFFLKKILEFLKYRIFFVTSTGIIIII